MKTEQEQRFATGTDRDLLESIFALLIALAEKITGQRPQTFIVDDGRGAPHTSIKKVEWMGEPNPGLAGRAIRFLESLHTKP